MRFKQYLNEKELSNEEILALIEKDCKPFLTDWRKLKTDKFLMSGRKDDTFFTKKKVRKNRKPKSTPLSIHKLMNHWFHEKFGVKSRSNAVFCSFNEKLSNYYGKLFSIFPIGKYNAVSSKSISDLFVLFTNMQEVNHQEIIKAMEKGNYTDKLTYHENEIMITCKKYYMVDYLLTDYLLENLKG